ncbi:VanW family protein [Patescibacteria group bacterium]|nr:VanW family protein [Patescibacteria group bacterium]
MIKNHLNLMKFDIKKNRRYKTKISFYFLAILIILGSYFFIFQKIYALTIYPRTYCCGNFNLSGLELKEAEASLNSFIEKIELAGFSFQAKTDLGEDQINIDPQLISIGDPDLTRSLVRFDVTATLEQAYTFGRDGNFFQKAYQMIFALAKDKKVDLIIDINEIEIEGILKENFQKLEKPSQNVSVVLNNKSLVLRDEQPGFVLDYQKAIKQLRINLIILKNEEIQILTVQEEPLIKIQEALAVLNQAQEIFDSAPYILMYQNQKWDLPIDKVISWMKIEKNNLGQVNLAFENEEILNYLVPVAQEINIEPKQRRLSMIDNRVTEFQVGETGFILNTEKSAELITEKLLSVVGEIELEVEKLEPDPWPEDLESLGIKELLGRGVSNFAGSPKNRRRNIAVGVQKLHGLLIKPDEEFSLIKALWPIDKESGYLPELVIKGDRTVPEYGGGLCQISTTTFRTVLNAGLVISERQNHSYQVVYYEPVGTDATIYGPKPDFRFINDTGYHILFQARTEGDELIFEFYGTSDGRRVETSKPEVFNITDPGPVKFIETDNLKPGEKKKVESAHAGANAKFKNTIFFANGIVREDVWKSYYRPWPEVWLVGKEIEKIEEEIKD